MADPRLRIQDGGHQNDHFISNMKFICKYLSEYTFRKYIIDALHTQKSIFTPSGTVFSNFIALELLSETLRKTNDVIVTSYHVTVRISA